MSILGNKMCPCPLLLRDSGNVQHEKIFASREIGFPTVKMPLADETGFSGFLQNLH